ncbi:MAG: heparan-alpha-glucosaminide N-acetyltransferase domain-containing protein [Candidatus Thermoplasmatota archaeon]|nr:heparan-alpha-glucosaminide N-acetyltransferase domain-containing protein [Candidatus Thermoplasmatota archaeon]
MEQVARNRSVDSLRGLAVLLMVMVHAAATWNPFYSAQSSILAYSVAGLGGLAAPLFVTIFGWGLAKSRASQRSNLIKAIILLLLQVIVNLSSPHLYDVFTPGILSLFALLILLKPLILKIISTMQTLFGFVGITVVMILFNDLVYNIQGSNSWDSRVFTDSIVTALNHLLLTGTYPLFPWMIYAVVGAFLGSSITEGGKTLPRNNTTLLLIIIGVCYCLFTLISANVTGSIWAHPTEGDYLNFFPANIGFLIGSMTGGLIFWLLIQEGKILVFESSGRLSLTIYTFHFIPLTLLSNLENEKDWTVMEASQAVVLFTTAWLIFAFVWNKFQWLTIENLIRKLSSG